ncbi:MAG: DNA polymerase III subunit alpha, partial [Nitrospirae bacterium]|nr:DNA polymerase III subunit alpha [Nitrospirota bacterium]
TDHGNIFGAIEFYRAAVKAGIKPIIGCEVYVAPDGRFNKKSSSSGENAFHLILLARNMDGYRNLVTLVSRAYLEGFYYKPRIDLDLLEQYSGGLIALSSCLHGEIPYHLAQGMVDEAREIALRYKNILGPENFYLEVQDNGIELQYEVNRRLIELSRELHIGLAATNDCHYLRKEDSRAHDILLCIQTGKTINARERMRFETDQLYFKSPDEMKRAFSEIPEAVLNTRAIAERCNLEFKLDTFLLPRFEVEGGDSPEGYLERLSREGLKRKVGEAPPETYSKRLDYELETIKKMGFASYFLIVWDFINFARNRGIPVGPGRGSAAGSLVAYCLDITEIDPIRYNLLFERFLNPDRISMPDIDVDFCKDRRPEVINYVAEKYGSEHVAQIITFGSMAARAVIRDVGRALDIPYAEVDRIAKLIPGGPNVTIDAAMATEPKLKEACKAKPEIRELIEIAKRLEGLSRHASTHAAGVVISPSPLTDYTPLYKSPSDESVTTQFDMKSIEAIGLLKFDFLGLKTLTVIEETLKYLQGTDKAFDIKSIPFDDRKTYELLSAGHTTGVFQLESSGMKEILVKMQPSRFEDLIALVALYRPGPIGSGMIDDFISRKKGLTKTEYELPQLREILDETYGVILYQEQVMRIANKLAGFTMGQADVLRKAMGKKDRDKMEKLLEEFVRGATENGIEEAKARRIFDLMAFFAEYGFNKSHSAAYAYLSYQTAYLKAHFPVEFMAANLSQEDSTDKIVRLINECRAMGIEILPPDINLSESRFTVVGNSIRFGLDAVKGVGEAAVEQILEARRDGPFESIEDLVRRVTTRKVNRKVMESLVKAGALDSLVSAEDPGPRNGGHGESGINAIRAMAMEKLNRLLDGRNNLSLFGQQSFFGGDDTEKVQPWSDDELLNAEKEALGFYITGHPINKYRRILGIMGVLKTSRLEELDDTTEVTVSGIINTLKKTLTKGKAETMAVYALEDDEGTVECIAFPEIYRNYSDLIVKNNLVMVRGTIDKSEKGIKVLTREITTPEDAFLSQEFKIELRLGAGSLEEDSLRKIKDLLQEHGGNCPVYIKLNSGDYETTILTEHNIRPDMDIIDSLETFAGDGNVRLLRLNGHKDAPHAANNRRTFRRAAG